MENTDKKTEFILGYRGRPPYQFPRDHARRCSVSIRLSASSKPALKPKSVQRREYKGIFRGK